MVLCAHPRTTSHGWWTIGLIMLLACTVGDNDDNAISFGDPTHNPGTPSSTSSPNNTTATGGKEDDPLSPTSGTSDAGDETETSSGTHETGDEVPSEQPASGMYSACLSPAMCVGQTTCFTITEGMDVVDGFCTSAPCTDAGIDCDASPGGSATPICFDMLVGGMETMGCALDCSSGKTCPAGMQCYTLATGEICV
jgi:hypothetical protein